MSRREHEQAVAFLHARLAVLDAALAYRAPVTPPPGVSFEDFAREILAVRS